MREKGAREDAGSEKVGNLADQGMERTVKFRCGTGKDIPQLAEMRIAYIREDMGLQGQREDALRRRIALHLSEHLGNDLFVYLADDGENLLATVFVVVVTKPASPFFPSGKTGIVMNVYTRPASRRKGYALRLMQWMLADMQGRDVAYLELKATEDGRELYQKVGFITEEMKYTPMKYVFKKA